MSLQRSSSIVTAKPRGGKGGKGSITTGAAYATVATYTPTSGKVFQLAKTLVGCDKDIIYQIRWNGSNISPEIYVAAIVPFPDWYPYNYAEMVGDGVKAIDIQAKFPTAGAAGTCFAEISGEEV